MLKLQCEQYGMCVVILQFHKHQHCNIANLEVFSALFTILYTHSDMVFTLINGH